MKTDVELKEIAVDLYDGKIFTDRHVNEHNSGSIGVVFMPILFGASKDGSKAADVGLIYEYLDKANPSSVGCQPFSQ